MNVDERWWTLMVAHERYDRKYRHNIDPGRFGKLSNHVKCCRILVYTHDSWWTPMNVDERLWTLMVADERYCRKIFGIKIHPGRFLKVSNYAKRCSTLLYTHERWLTLMVADERLWSQLKSSELYPILVAFMDSFERSLTISNAAGD